MAKNPVFSRKWLQASMPNIMWRSRQGEVRDAILQHQKEYARHQIVVNVDTDSELLAWCEGEDGRPCFRRWHVLREEKKVRWSDIPAMEEED